MEKIILGAFLVLFIGVQIAFAITTADRIHDNGYPVETHTVQTSDGYILTMFRIPTNTTISNCTSKPPIAFLNHGMVSSSDTFILNGPGIALAYILADAGYDVWLANNRGNTYCKKHLKHSAWSFEFWNFSWHEVGVYDLPALIDYVLQKTNQKSLHFVAYSQGTTVFLVLASMLPEYNTKIKSVHMISPIAFMKNIKGPLVPILTSLLAHPNTLNRVLGKTEIVPSNRLRDYGCTFSSYAKWLCAKGILSLWFGTQSFDISFNMTLFPEFLKTHPAGMSTKQLVHHFQGHVSHKFQQFDHGPVENKLIYGRDTPPEYNLKKITAPSFVYYAVNDYYSARLDVERLIESLPNVKYSFRIPDPNWNHLNFLCGNNAKETFIDRVFKNINKMERVLSSC